MILPDLVLPVRANQTLTSYGLDTLEYAADKKHYLHYPYEVVYQYNSRGFRDSEWPADDQLSDAIWCIGDSFTTGMGNRFQHTWPQILQSQTHTRTINVGLDGASNNWIAEKATDVIQQVKPKNLVIMWTFFHRRQLDDVTVPDSEKQYREFRTTYVEDFENSYSLITKLNTGQTNVVHVLVPQAFFFSKNDADKIWHKIKDPTWPESVPPQLSQLPQQILKELQEDLKCYNELNVMLRYKDLCENWPNCIGEVNQVDFSRDGFHCGLKTHQTLTEQIIPLLR